jgi:hypothetical protein
MMARWLTALTLVLAAALSGCETAEEQALKESPSYNAGFGDGCNTAESERAVIKPPPQRDATLYAKDADYRRGWNAGHAFCGPMLQRPQF